MDGTKIHYAAELLEAPLVRFFNTNDTLAVDPLNDPVRRANAVKDAFEAMMEGVALLLDLVGQVEFTYITKSGNSVHVVMNSP